MSKIPHPPIPLKSSARRMSCCWKNCSTTCTYATRITGKRPAKWMTLLSRPAGQRPTYRPWRKTSREHVKHAVKRDLHSLAGYNHSGQQGAEGWLGFELHQLEGRLKDLIPRAADPSVTDWLEWKSEMERLPYHTGEITGPGVLVCDKCGDKMHFTKPGHIPPCPKCGGTTFHRLSDHNG